MSRRPPAPLLACLALAALALALLASACRFDAPPGTSPGQPDGTSDGTGSGTNMPPDAKVYLDAPPAVTCSPTTCGVAGGFCVAATGHCQITRTINVGVTCPANHFCDIVCAGQNDSCKTDGVDCTNAIGCTVQCGNGGGGDDSCRGGVKCPQSGPCTVTCNGGGACQNEAVTCGTGLCDVHCTGTNACGDHTIDCSKSAMCKVDCEGDNACRNGAVTCGPGTCNVECDGLNACQNFPAVCAVMPATCELHCCGSPATCQNNSTRCSACVKDNVCD